jgi:hypothetical protein
MIAAMMGILNRTTKRAKISIINLEILWFPTIYTVWHALSIYFIILDRIEIVDGGVLFLYLGRDISRIRVSR